MAREIPRDITPEPRASEDVRRSEELYSKIFRGNPVAMGIASTRDGRILDVNDAAIRLAARPREAMIGRTGTELALWVDLEQVPHGMECHEVPTRVRRGTGEILDVRLSTEPIEVRGEPCILYVVTDVTALRRAERRLEEAQEIGRVGSWVVDLETRNLTWSPEARRIFGMPDRPFQHQDFIDHIHPDDRERVVALGARMVESGDAWNHEYRILRGTGEFAWVHGRGRVERDGAGKALRMFGTIQDITDQHQTNARFAASERRYRRILETAAHGVVTIDLTGTITFANNKLASMIGVATAQLIGYAARATRC